MNQDIALISVIVLQLLNLSTSISVEGSSIPVSNVTVFNAYVNQDLFAKASFGKEKMERINYGSYKTSPLSGSEDYIIQFVKLPSGGKNCIRGQELLLKITSWVYKRGCMLETTN